MAARRDRWTLIYCRAAIASPGNRPPAAGSINEKTGGTASESWEVDMNDKQLIVNIYRTSYGCMGIPERLELKKGVDVGGSRDRRTTLLIGVTAGKKKVPSTGITKVAGTGIIGTHSDMIVTTII